jgi:hypothetical protein
MERLAKELRALLEFIEDCYPNCDIDTFRHQVISRLSKIVPKEIVPHAVANQGKAWTCLRHPYATRSSFVNKNIEQAARDHPRTIHRGKTHGTLQDQFHRLALHDKNKRPRM